MPKLRFEKVNKRTEINLPKSKSISNRLLIIQALSKPSFQLEDLSEAEDTRVLQAAINNENSTINVGMAGTAYRFLTALYASQEGKEVCLRGAERMHERPVMVLVEALQNLGADISYLEKEGYPPLKISGKTLDGGQLDIEAGTSSQYISALLLIAPRLKHGLQLTLKGRISSKPYIAMTLDLMKNFGIEFNWQGNQILVKPGSYRMSEKFQVERDWSSAAFFYQMVALSDGLKVSLPKLTQDSSQGDKRLVEVFKSFGVQTEGDENGILLQKRSSRTNLQRIDLLDCPDLIPSVAVTAAVLSKELMISGVKTLRIKETDRVKALQIELAKMGAHLIDLSENEIQIIGSKNVTGSLKFATYGDHRMAMAFAPLAIIYQEIEIEDVNVVQKSFPNYWEEADKCGIKLS